MKENSVPQVSVLMPVYNGERYLAEAVSSILAQSFQDFELLIMNDGSTDRTAVVLNEFLVDPRVRLITNPKNLGLIASLNIGLGACRAPLIARMDADDIAMPDRLQKQCQRMTEEPGLGVLGGQVQVIDEYGGPIGRFEYPLDDTSIRKCLEHTSPFAHPAAMIRADLLRQVGGYRVFYKHCEDFDLWLRLAEITCMANLDDVLLRYRQHGQNIVVVHRKAMALGHWLAEGCAQVRKAGLPDPTRGWTTASPALFDTLPLSRPECWRLKYAWATTAINELPLTELPAGRALMGELESLMQANCSEEQKQDWVAANVFFAKRALSARKLSLFVKAVANSLKHAPAQMLALPIVKLQDRTRLQSKGDEAARVGFIKTRHILLFIQVAFTGGSRTYAKQLIAFYARHGYRLTVIEMGPENDKDMVAFCAANGAKHINCLDAIGELPTESIKPWKWYRGRVRVKALMEQLQPDLVVVSAGIPWTFLGWTGLGKHSIYILHAYPELSKTWQKRFVRWLLWQLAMPGKINYMTVSLFARQRMLEEMGTLRYRNKIHVVYNSAGALIDSAAVSADEAKPMMVLTVGDVADHKNPLFWIDVAAQVLRVQPQIKFVWIGPGPLLEECREKVKGLNLQGKIEFLGWSDSPGGFYENCDIYVHPSKSESLGFAVLDAMRYGKPCIVAAAGGLPETVDAGSSGWVEGIGSPDGFVRRILQLATDADMRRSMGQYGQALYKRRFSPAQWEMEMKSFLNKVWSE